MRQLCSRCRPYGQLLGTAAMLAGATHPARAALKGNEAYQPAYMQGISNTAAFLPLSPRSRPPPANWTLVVSHVWEQS